MSHGSVFVTLSKGLYSPGSQVDGTISLNLLQTVPGASQVLLNIRGLEETKLVERYQTTEYYTDANGNRQSRTKTHYRTHTGTNPFFNHTFVVYQFNTAYMPAGQYSFPVSFILQSGLPSTFNQEFTMHGYYCYARVNYTMTVTVPSSGMFRSLSRVQHFVVNQQLVMGNSTIRQDLAKKITSCCCLDQGTTHITTYFEKSEYVPGEKAYMVTEIDNSKCKSRINSISGNLTQVLNVVAGSYSHSITTRLHSDKLLGIGPGDCLLAEHAQRLAVPINGPNSVVLQPTCRGKLVNNEYLLICMLSMDACTCCEKDPSCALAVNIRNPEPVDIPNEMPSDWRPTQMEKFNATFDKDKQEALPNYPEAPAEGMMGQPPVYNPGMPSMPGMPNEAPSIDYSVNGREPAKPPIAPYHPPTMPGSAPFPGNGPSGANYPTQ